MSEQDDSERGRIGSHSQALRTASDESLTPSRHRSLHSTPQDPPISQDGPTVLRGRHPRGPAANPAPTEEAAEPREAPASPHGPSPFSGTEEPADVLKLLARGLQRGELRSEPKPAEAVAAARRGEEEAAAALVGALTDDSVPRAVNKVRGLEGDEQAGEARPAVTVAVIGARYCGLAARLVREVPLATVVAVEGDASRARACAVARDADYGGGPHADSQPANGAPPKGEPAKPADGGRGASGFALCTPRSKLAAARGLSSALADATAGEGARLSVVVVQDLAQAVPRGSLPHATTEALAGLLRVADVLFLPAGLPKRPEFAAWPDGKALADHIADAVVEMAEGSRNGAAAPNENSGNPRVRPHVSRVEPSASGAAGGAVFNQWPTPGSGVWAQNQLPGSPQNQWAQWQRPSGSSSGAQTSSLGDGTVVYQAPSPHHRDSWIRIDSGPAHEVLKAVAKSTKDAEEESEAESREDKTAGGGGRSGGSGSGDGDQKASAKGKTSSGGFGTQAAGDWSWGVTLPSSSPPPRRRGPEEDAPAVASGTLAQLASGTHVSLGVLLRLGLRPEDRRALFTDFVVAGHRVPPSRAAVCLGRVCALDSNGVPEDWESLSAASARHQQDTSEDGDDDSGAESDETTKPDSKEPGARKSASSPTPEQTTRHDRQAPPSPPSFQLSSKPESDSHNTKSIKHDVHPGGEQASKGSSSPRAAFATPGDARLSAGDRDAARPSDRLPRVLRGDEQAGEANAVLSRFVDEKGERDFESAADVREDVAEVSSAEDEEAEEAWSAPEHTQEAVESSSRGETKSQGDDTQANDKAGDVDVGSETQADVADDAGIALADTDMDADSDADAGTDPDADADADHAGVESDAQMDSEETDGEEEAEALMARARDSTIAPSPHRTRKLLGIATPGGAFAAAARARAVAALASADGDMLERAVGSSTSAKAAMAWARRQEAASELAAGTHSGSRGSRAAAAAARAVAGAEHGEEEEAVSALRAGDADEWDDRAEAEAEAEAAVEAGSEDDGVAEGGTGEVSTSAADVAQALSEEEQRRLADVWRAEGRLAAAWERVLRRELATSDRGAILASGDGIATLALSLARAAPRRVIVAHLATRRAASLAAAAADALALPNLVAAAGTLSPPVTARLRRAADPFRYQFLDVSVLRVLVGAARRATALAAASAEDGAAVDDRVAEAAADAMENALGAVLTLASTSFVELPPWSVLMHALDAFASPSEGLARTRAAAAGAAASLGPRLHALYRTRGRASAAADASDAVTGDARRSLGLVLLRRAAAASAVRRADLAPAVVRAISRDGEHSDRILVRVDLHPWARRDATASPPSAPTPLALNARFRAATASLKSDLGPLRGVQGPVSAPGASLFSLLALGAAPEHKAQILQLYLQLPESAFFARGGEPLPADPVAMRLHAPEATEVSASLAFHADATHQGAKDAAANGATSVSSSQSVRNGDRRWSAIRSQLTKSDTACGGAQGKFSFVDWGAGLGALATEVAAAFPLATVVSVEKSRPAVDAHLLTLERRNVTNNAVCVGEWENLAEKAYNSPEFFRFQALGPPVHELLLDMDAEKAGFFLGRWFALAMTSFVQIPSERVMSLAMTTLFHHARPLTHETRTDPTTSAADWAAERAGPPLEAASQGLYDVMQHPRPGYRHAAARMLAVATKAEQGNHVALTTIRNGDVELARVDIVDMQRRVGHHFDYRVDGHSRKYDMHVQRNKTAASHAPGTALAPGNHPDAGHVVSVQLTRVEDTHHIPYTTLYGITLIAVLRMGLVSTHRERAYRAFVKLPLYEDMAPWNIVFEGSGVEYIDYDTRGVTFDDQVAKTYQVLSVLFNYKRTVQDFNRCGFKTSNGPYNFPYMSECVGGQGTEKPPSRCPTSERPVPCEDGSCQTDYISCLKAMVRAEERKEVSGRGTKHGEASEERRRVEAWLAKGEWRYDSSGMVLKTKEEEEKEADSADN